MEKNSRLRNKLLLAGCLILYQMFPIFYIPIHRLILDWVGVEVTGQIQAASIPGFTIVEAALRAFFLFPLYSLLLTAKRDGQFWRRARILYLNSILFYTYLCFFSYAVLTDTFKTGVTIQQQEEVAAFIFSFVVDAAVILFLVYGKVKWLFLTASSRYVFTFFLDIVLLPRLMERAVAYTQIIPGLCVGIGMLIVLQAMRPEEPVKKPERPGQQWVLGAAAGLQSLVRSACAILIIGKILDMLPNQDIFIIVGQLHALYIWMPTIILAEMVRREDNMELIPEYALIAIDLYLLNLILIMISNVILEQIFGITDEETISTIISLSLTIAPFYILYQISSILSSIFIATGRLINNLIASAVTCLGYFPISYMMILLLKPEFTDKMFCYLLGGGLAVNCLCLSSLYFGQKRKTASRK